MWAGKNNFMLILYKKSLSWTFCLRWLQAAVEFWAFWQARRFRQGDSHHSSVGTFFSILYFSCAIIYESIVCYAFGRLSLHPLPPSMEETSPAGFCVQVAVGRLLCADCCVQVAVGRLLWAGFVLSHCPFNRHFLTCPCLRECSCLPTRCLRSTSRLTFKLLQEFLISPAAPGSTGSCSFGWEVSSLGWQLPMPQVWIQWPHLPSHVWVLWDIEVVVLFTLLNPECSFLCARHPE